jgi:pimeloyl-ACP methyl ester carboxylesterase
MSVSYMLGVLPKKVSAPVYGLEFAGCGKRKDRLPLPKKPNAWRGAIRWSIEKLGNPIVVAHSFGAMLTLLLSGRLHGDPVFVLVSASPNNQWIENAKRIQRLRKNELREARELETILSKKPSDLLMKKLMAAWAPYYFPKRQHGAKERRFLYSMSQSFLANEWGTLNAFERRIEYLTAKSSVLRHPTYFIFGSSDLLTPEQSIRSRASLFLQEPEIIKIKGQGHFPWWPNEVDFHDAMSYIVARSNLPE